jgi:hypothetical protein
MGKVRVITKDQAMPAITDQDTRQAEISWGDDLESPGYVWLAAVAQSNSRHQRRDE